MVIEFNAQPPTLKPGTERNNGIMPPGPGASEKQPVLPPRQIGNEPGRVRISDQGRSLQRIEQQLQGSSEVRESKVAEIRQAINEGRYQPNPEQMAKKMFSFESMLDK